MLSKLKEGNKTHISHFHRYVSIYERNRETVDWLIDTLKNAIDTAKKEREPQVDWLIDTLKNAIDTAKKEREPQIVNQDSMEHIFVCWPSGDVSLYREVGHYEVNRYVSIYDWPSGDVSLYREVGHYEVIGG